MQENKKLKPEELVNILTKKNLPAINVKELELETAFGLASLQLNIPATKIAAQEKILSINRENPSFIPAVVKINLSFNQRIENADAFPNSIAVAISNIITGQVDNIEETYQTLETKFATGKPILYFTKLLTDIKAEQYNKEVLPHLKKAAADSPQWYYASLNHVLKADFINVSSDEFILDEQRIKQAIKNYNRNKTALMPKVDRLYETSLMAAA
jgi:hypothetical protein